MKNEVLLEYLRETRGAIFTVLTELKPQDSNTALFIKCGNDLAALDRVIHALDPLAHDGKSWLIIYHSGAMAFWHHYTGAEGDAHAYARSFDSHVKFGRKGYSLLPVGPTLKVFARDEA